MKKRGGGIFDCGLDSHQEIIISLHLKHRFEMTDDSLGREVTIWVFSVNQIRALSQCTYNSANGAWPFITAPNPQQRAPLEQRLSH